MKKSMAARSGCGKHTPTKFQKKMKKVEHETLLTGNWDEQETY
eukprot:CAMPEP_0178806072 /NCGR_PEP_ID=MMETSP0745-20121128/16116_1 /TAXON_ID=913974 /ORGANISM="Nitzschia punctata, Strain CCMP561" /LENGTH=42 /DNA_ID= /DNA_START= /DNA_END= /DNA_ORIENTATION=